MKPRNFINITILAAFLQNWRDFYKLTKPRITQLAVFCALIGMLLAQREQQKSWLLLVPALIGIWMLVSSAFAINCLIEKNIDRKMLRTVSRPSASGKISTSIICFFAVFLSVFGASLLCQFANLLTAYLTVITFFSYAVIYTIWLKPATPQNIVIGGISGAMPPVLGWSAVTNELAPESLILALIIFVWTPPHFWALALYRCDDYAKSQLPMLPITHGKRLTCLHILLYTCLVVAVSCLPFIFQISQFFYLTVSLILGGIFFLYTWKLYHHYSDHLAKKIFRYSIFYLTSIFSALLLDRYLF